MGIYTQAVQQLYVAYFNRPADPSGLAYWENVTAAQGGSTAAISTAFSQSAEYQAKYANMNNDQIVNTVYQNLFGRSAESTGLLFWSQALNEGRMTVADAVTNIAAGAQGTDATAYANKVTGATSFTTALDTAEEILAYSGAAANETATNWLSAITDDASLTTQTAAIDTTVTSIVSTGGSSTGQTFTLTNSTDAFTGGSGNDTFIGDNVSASAGDTLVGATGTDTLKLYGAAAKPNFTGIETVYLNGNTAGMDVSTNSDVTTLQLDDVTSAQTYTIGSNTANVSVANMAATEIVDFAGNTVTALNVALNKNGTAAGANDVQIDFNSTAQTSVSFTTATAKSYIELLNTGAKLNTVNIAGDQIFSLESALSTVTTIDASAATGNVTIAGVGASNLTFTGGTGDDKIVMGATLTANDTLTGGTGTDTVSISDADTMDSAAEVAKVTGFEIFEAAAADATTYNLSFLGANNTLTGLVVNGAATVTVSNINAATTGNIKIVADTTTVLTATDFVSGGTSDTATITLDDSAAKTGSGIDVANLTFANLDVLNLVSKSDGTPTKTVGGAEENSITVTATDLEKIVVTGDESVNLQTAAGTLPTEIDASGVTDAAVTVDTDASAIVSVLVKGTAKNDTIDIDNAATVTSTLYLGGGSDTVVVDGGGTDSHTLKYTATELNAGDIKAGDASTVTLTGVAAGDVVTIDFSSALEALLKSGGTVLGSSAADVNIHGTTLSATTNIAAAQAGGNMVLQIDLNGDGSYNAANDYQITLVGTGTNDTLVYNAAADTLIFTVVA